jgi:glutamine amidotransferase
MTAHIFMIDYGMSNLASLARSLGKSGTSPKFSSDPADLIPTDKIILPGVGSFAQDMANLHRLGRVEPLRDIVKQRSTPMLGICLGMQLLASSGTEGHDVEGLNLILGKVVKLKSSNNINRISHVGWNNISRSTKTKFEIKK